MGYWFPGYPHSVFTPSSMALPKKKAKELRSLVKDVPLSLAQQTTAKALGWSSWYALEQGVKGAREFSPLDDDATEDERNSRWSTQFEALNELHVYIGDIEGVIAKWGLTCSYGWSQMRQADVGPWGAFMEPPTEVAPGIVLGECAKFSCYRLSPERHAAMPAHLRVDSWDGWYMNDDHGYRVVLSWPELFDEKAVEAAWSALEIAAPLLYNLCAGPSRSSRFGCSLSSLRESCARRMTEWFALSAFPDWSFVPGALSTNCPICVVSAIQGRDLLRLLDELGVWPSDGSIRWRWLAVDKEELRQRLDLSYTAFRSESGEASPFLYLTGLRGYEHPPIARLPFKFQPLASDELSLWMGRGFEALVSEISPGVFETIA